VPGAYISEGWFWRDDIDATDRDELYSDRSVAFALSYRAAPQGVKIVSFQCVSSKNLTSPEARR
jgi:hypothetical protein